MPNSSSSLNNAYYMTIFAEPSAPKDPCIYSAIQSQTVIVGANSTQVLRDYSIRQHGDRLENSVGSHFGKWDLRWKFIADDHWLKPNQVFCGEALDPKRSQRFSMNDLFRFSGGVGFQGFGCGQTMPLVSTGPTKLRVAAVGNVVNGLGSLRGKQGSYTLDGILDLEKGFSGLVLLRVANEKDDNSECHMIPHSMGSWVRARDIVHRVFHFEQEATATVLKQVELQYTSRGGLRGRMLIGPELGLAKLQVIVNFDELNHSERGSPLTPLPFLAHATCSFGNNEDGFSFQLIEGRAFRLAPGAPAIRFGGFGMITNGRGYYSDKQGVVLINGVAKPGSASGCLLIGL